METSPGIWVNKTNAAARRGDSPEPPHSGSPTRAPLPRGAHPRCHQGAPLGSLGRIRKVPPAPRRRPSALAGGQGPAQTHRRRVGPSPVRKPQLKGPLPLRLAKRGASGSRPRPPRRGPGAPAPIPSRGRTPGRPRAGPAATRSARSPAERTPGCAPGSRGCSGAPSPAGPHLTAPRSRRDLLRPPGVSSPRGDGGGGAT